MLASMLKTGCNTSTRKSNSEQFLRKQVKNTSVKFVLSYDLLPTKITCRCGHDTKAHRDL